MNWENIKQGNCPTCNKKLKFRLAGSKNSIRSRQGQTLRDNEDYYFCFRCDFQITGSKLFLLQKKINPEISNLVKDCKYLGH